MAGVPGDGDLDARSVRAGGGVERVVDEVARQRHDVTRLDPVARRAHLAVDGQGDATLGGLRGLAEQQGGQHRVLHRADDPVGEQLGDLELLGGELHRVVRPAHLDQRHHGVQAVGGLVVLGAQRVGEAAHHVELTGDRLELGAVTQGDDCSHLAPLPERGRGAHHQHVLARDVDVVRLRGLADRGAHQRRGKPQLAHRPADRIGGQVEQAARLVVHELHPVLVVQEQQALRGRRGARRGGTRTSGPAPAR